jgi:hypothetical protein
MKCVALNKSITIDDQVFRKQFGFKKLATFFV